MKKKSNIFLLVSSLALLTILLAVYGIKLTNEGKTKDETSQSGLKALEDFEYQPMPENNTLTIEGQNDFSYDLEIKIPKDLFIPVILDGVEFAEVDDYVYAKGKVKLYASPAFNAESDTAIFEAFDKQKFRRVGVSDEGIYQLVSEDGLLLYAQGDFFEAREEASQLN